MITNIFRIFLTRSFKPFVLQSGQEDIISIDEKNLGLYIHIPFCKKICSFCPYYKVLYDKDLMEKYVASLLKEIKLVAALNENRAKITSIYFGGGSPALAIDYLPEIMASIDKTFNISENIGIELHPRDINKDLIKDLRSIGFDMISIGVQSFQEKCLHALGRDNIDSIKKMQIAVEGGFKVIDIDLIFGIPGQTSKDITRDFEIAEKNGATQISTYPFIEFSYSDLKSGPAGQKVKKKMLEDLIDISQIKDFKRTSVWTFSKKGYGAYSSITRDNYIGFGPGAASLTKNIFKINTFSVKEYIKSLSGGKLPTALTIKFDKRRRALYWLFWSAYNLHLNRTSFRDLFNEKLDSFFGFEIFLGKKLKLIKEEKEGYEVTFKGAQLYHLVEQVYTHQYIDKTWKIASGDPWPKKIILY